MLLTNKQTNVDENITSLAGVINFLGYEGIAGATLERLFQRILRIILFFFV